MRETFGKTFNKSQLMVLLQMFETVLKHLCTKTEVNPNQQMFVQSQIQRQQIFLSNVMIKIMSLTPLCFEQHCFKPRMFQKYRNIEVNDLNSRLMFKFLLQTCSLKMLCRKISQNSWGKSCGGDLFSVGLQTSSIPQNSIVDFEDPVSLKYIKYLKKIFLLSAYKHQARIPL